MIRSNLLKHLPNRLTESNIIRRFVSGAFWSLTSNILVRFVNLAVAILIARTLGKISYGQYGIIQTTIIMFGSFAGLGLGMTATKYVAQFRNTDRDKTGSIISLLLVSGAVSCSFIAVILIVSAQDLAASILVSPQLTPLLRLGAIVLFLDGLNGVQSGVLAGLESFRSTARANLISGLVSLPVTVIGVILFGLTGAIIGLASFSLVNFVLCNWSFRAACRSNGVFLKWKGSLVESRLLWTFCLPAFLSNILVAPVNWLCATLLVRQPSGYNEMAVYNAAGQLRNLMVMLPAVFSSIALPMLASSSQNVAQDASFSKIMDMNQKAIILVVIPLTICLVFFGDLYLRIYGKDYTSGYPVLVALIAGISISAIGSPAGSGIQAKGNMWAGTLMNVSWGISYLIYVYFMVESQGAIALAVGFAIAHVILLVWGYTYLLPDLPKGMFRRTMLSVTLIVIVSALAICLPRGIRYGAALPVGLLSVYFLRNIVGGRIARANRN